MELPQPRPFGTEGTERKRTHDFLSLYSAAHQDQRSAQGGFLKTHDFLQPLEQQGRNGAREEGILEIKDAGKPPPAASLPWVEHLIPGGIETNSNSYFNQRFTISKPEGNVFSMAQTNSNSRNHQNSNAATVFTLWDESAMKKGKTGKENSAGDRAALRVAEAGVDQGDGQWTTSLERTSQPSSKHKQNKTTFSSPSSSQPSSANRNQTFMDMITSARSYQEEDDEEEEEFVIKKEPSSYSTGNLSVKVDGKIADQKPSTPRSKHSATEQRRRSKINDRFQKLREIIPHGDQKRDKASFLLEVIEYIQFLQEKVNKYEEVYQVWNQEPAKILPWINQRNRGNFSAQNQPANIDSGPAIRIGSKFDETKPGKSAVLPISGQHLVESDISSGTNLGERIYHAESLAKAEPGPQPQQPNDLSRIGASSTPQPFSSTPERDVDKMPCQTHSQIRSDANTAVMDKHKDRELSIESGTISISSRYSQGLLNTLTQALQSSGVDLTQASISVQIDLGKRANGTVNYSASVIKDIEIPTSIQAMATTSSVKSKADEPSQAMKRLKTSISWQP